MIKADVLVIGSGISGLSYAIKISEQLPDAKITIVTKSDEDESNTKYAQGGLAVVTDFHKDNFEKHIEDTMRAGDGCFDSVKSAGFILFSVFDFRAKCRRLVMQHNVKIIMVDYLQLMTANNGGKANGNREQEIATISRSLKAIAKELNVPVIALSQLSRTVESRPGKRPQLSDLRESGAIEQDADIVSFIFRPEYYKIATWDNDPEGQQTSTENQAELIIAKHRNGATADVRLSFFKNIAKFADLDIFANEYGYPTPNFGKQDEPSGFDRIKTTIDPGAAFDIQNPEDYSGLSGSSMNDFDEDEDDPMPF